jgi:hypothetical protein
LVGEFFEVRAQVDRDLTTVSRVDRRLGLIKNLGRHNGICIGACLRPIQMSSRLYQVGASQDDTFVPGAG